MIVAPSVAETMASDRAAARSADRPRWQRQLVSAEVHVENGAETACWNCAPVEALSTVVTATAQLGV
jgi:hypothetical protein